MMSSSLSLLFLLQLGHAVAGSWADHALNNGTMTHNNETVTSSTSLVPTASPAPPIHQFHVGVTRAGRRYQTGRRYWAFSGDDAIVTDNINDAAWFHYQEGYLKSEDKYVNIDGGSGYSGLELSSDAPEDKYAISKDDDGNLELTGADYTVGKGHGIFCTSDDGNVFVIASKRPPFRCHSVNLRSRGSPSSPKGQQGQQGQQGQHGSSPPPSGSSHAGNNNGKPTLSRPLPDSRPSPNQPQPPSRPHGGTAPEHHSPAPNSPPTGNTHNHHPTPSPTTTHSGSLASIPSPVNHNGNNGGPSNTHEDANDDHQWTDAPTTTRPSPVEDDEGEKDHGAPPAPDPSSDPDPDIEDDSSKLLDLPGKLLHGIAYWGDAA